MTPAQKFIHILSRGNPANLPYIFPLESITFVCFTFRFFCFPLKFLCFTGFEPHFFPPFFYCLPPLHGFFGTLEFTGWLPGKLTGAEDPEASHPFHASVDFHVKDWRIIPPIGSMGLVYLPTFTIKISQM